MDINKEALGMTIQEIRLNMGLNMREFGILVGNASDSIVSRWEKGKSIPNPERLKKIASLQNKTTTELIKYSYYIFIKKYVYDFFVYNPREDVDYILNNDKEKIDNAVNGAFELLYDHQRYINSSADKEILKNRIDEICDLAFNQLLEMKQYTNDGAVNYVYSTIKEIKANLPEFFYRRYSESLWNKEVQKELRTNADLILLNNLDVILGETLKKIENDNF